jgi:acetyltransferase-like isoleucine patch superfamily enzyme
MKGRGDRHARSASGTRWSRARATKVTDRVELGPDAVIDENVRLGYVHVAGDSTEPLRLGANARVRSGSVLYAGSRIARGVMTGHNVVIKHDTSIGDECQIADNTVVECGCTIGERVRIQANCHIGEFTTIEDDVFIGSGTVMASDPYPGSDAPFVRGPTIKRGAEIGANVTLLPSVVVGEAALVRAGSVVTHNIVAGTVVGGDPARAIGLEPPGGEPIVLPRLARRR